jgi:RNA-directed DNA polymerase
LQELQVRQHPDKTFIGRVERGFDFLSYRLSPGGIAVAPATAERFGARLTRHEERGAAACRIGEYVRRWCGWVRSGLGDWVRWLRWPAWVVAGSGGPGLLPDPPGTT